MSEHRSRWRWVWLAALGCFVLAGSTGILLRFGMLLGFPYGLQYANVRHAHSHLMYFGWVTLAAMGLMAAWLPELTGRPFSPHRSRLFKWSLILILLLSLAAYVPFLLFGYRSAVVGTVRLPLSTIAAGLNMVAWYWFGWLYWQET
ncbi:MAG: hypothetical protein KC419_15615, partial [Anaerolineales bacterium]|nr:hypothetical protein [Anaerolineales bacterium]